MQIEERLVNDVGILQLAGRLTVNDQPGLLKQAVASLVQNGVRHVIVDLSHVRYVDSTRLGELIAAYVLLSRHGGRFALAGTPPRVRALLDVSSLTHVFERFDTVEAAEASLTTSAPV